MAFAGEKVWAIVPAAGKGLRINHVLAKQFLRIGGRTILDYSLSELLRLTVINRLYLVVTAETPVDITIQDSRIYKVVGGAERHHSVLNALHALAPQAKAEDWVLVHDAARPCVLAMDIEKLIEQLKNHSVGGLLGMPVRDTLKRAPCATVCATLDRSELWHALTPQLFRFDILYQSLNAAIKAGRHLFDEASAVEYFGLRPRIVTGRSDNIKITYPEDLALAEFFLRKQGRIL